MMLAVTLLTVTVWAAQEKVLRSFNIDSHGYLPQAGLVRDAAGNLYGTAQGGGILSCNVPDGCGVVFELSPDGNGDWSEKVLHSFGSGSDGIYPISGLVLDAAGNLYGATWQGGIHNDGVIFELSPRQGGGWTEKVLHNFDGGSDGYSPVAGLILDSSGNLYSTTGWGGLHGYGTVFELSPEGGGWTKKVLHSFGGGSDGRNPFTGLTMDATGNLYGTTRNGGIHGSGTIFELSPRGDGEWSEKVLHSFNDNGSDGYYPDAEVVFDRDGNLYTTTYYGGIHDGGTVLELSPRQGGGWSPRVLRSFGAGADGAYPAAALIFDDAGNLYSTTGGGGIHGFGTVFELSPRGGGWSEKILHSFDNRDGNGPESALIFDSAGNLYSTTDLGGIHGEGTVFQLTP
jgi:uncharacterized repeat protein (TIGR03803 family)